MATPPIPPDDPQNGLWVEAVWGAALIGSILFVAGLLAAFIA